MKEKHYLAAMYLRLSRDDSDIGDTPKGDGKVKFESNSIGSQRELIRAFIHEQKDIELYDSYVDDGYTGSNFERPEFKRMISDIEEGRVNCVIVKDLSRFGRDYIEAGRYIQKIFPALDVRFLALTDHYDSLSASAGESGIMLPVKNFINDSYCRDISMKVKSQLEIKRKNGECTAPFAVYGYQKDSRDKNRLIVDRYAAEIVKQIFEWKIHGLAVSAIADKLNGLGILSPKEYKKLTGNYRGGFSVMGRSRWSSPTVKRILTNEVYLGHLIQGKTEKVNYKIKKTVEKPKEEWVKVEDTHEAIVSGDTFRIVQNLLKTDTRISHSMESSSFFAGILFCGDCGEQMIRRVNHYKGKERVYYICSTKNRGEGCSRHSIEEGTLRELAGEIMRRYANAFLEEKHMFEKAQQQEINLDAAALYDTEISRLKKEQEKYRSLCSSLYEDLRKEIITKGEFERLHKNFNQKSEELEQAHSKQEEAIQKLFYQGVISAKRLQAMQERPELREVDRQILCRLVRQINVFENRRVEVEFYFADQFRMMQEVNQRVKEVQKKNNKEERCV